MANPTPLLEVRLLAEPFAPLIALEAWQAQLATQLPGGPAAAESHFIGRVRGHSSDGRAAVEALELEHYPGMTEARILGLAAAGSERHGADAVLVLHRIGRLAPGEAIVLVAVAADRRGQALRCGQELLEALKHEAPFWKREWRGGVGTWVQGNTPF
jgi:molybdopterin synthase catalytic subunit